MIDFFYQIIRTARPRQWLKNMALFAPALILGDISEGSLLYKLFNAFVSFSLMSSAAYFVNDIVDAPKDALHPIKKNRPIPSGKLSVITAWAVALVLMSTSILYSLKFTGNFFTIILIKYAKVINKIN